MVVAKQIELQGIPHEKISRKRKLITFDDSTTSSQAYTLNKNLTTPKDLKTSVFQRISKENDTNFNEKKESNFKKVPPAATNFENLESKPSIFQRISSQSNVKQLLLKSPSKRTLITYGEDSISFQTHTLEKPETTSEDLRNRLKSPPKRKLITYGKDLISTPAHTLKKSEEDLRNRLNYKITNDSIFKKPLTAHEIDSFTPEDLRKRLNFKDKAPQISRTKRLT